MTSDEERRAGWIDYRLDRIRKADLVLATEGPNTELVNYCRELAAADKAQAVDDLRRSRLL